jgi:SulP family sulfate permease
LRDRHRVSDIRIGGSRYQIGGPRGAFVVVVTAIVAEHGIQGLFMCTMMSAI